MNLLYTLIRKAPLVIVMLIILAAFVVGSHAGLDAFIAGQSGNCVPLDATHDLCIVTK